MIPFLGISLFFWFLDLLLLSASSPSPILNIFGSSSSNTDIFLELLTLIPFLFARELLGNTPRFLWDFARLLTLFFFIFYY